MQARRFGVLAGAFACLLAMAACQEPTGGNTVREYTVSFVTNGGTALPAVTVSSVKEAPPSTKGSYVASWYESPNFSGDAVTFPYTPERDTILYARWTEYWLVADANPKLSKQRNASLDGIFNNATLGEIVLTFSEAEWNTLLGNYDLNNKNETYVHGDFAYLKDGTAWKMSDVGIRLRGNTSRVRPESGQTHDPSAPVYHQAHFQLDFEKWLADGTDRKLSGAMDGVMLKWFKDDPSHVREMYCYDLFRRYGVWTAPRASYAKLTIKIGGDTAYYGIYEMIENVNKQSVKARKENGTFVSDAGDLWKCCWQRGNGPSLLKENSYYMGCENISLNENQSLRYDYDLKTNKTDIAAASARLQAFIDELNALDTADSAAVKAWYETHMDVDLFIKTLAVNVVLGMWDDYWQNKNNYYLYFDGDGKAYFLPYDYDNTLGTSVVNPFGDAGTKDPLNWGDSANRPLVGRLLSVGDFRDRYIACLKELTSSENQYFDVTASQSRIRAWQNLIEADIPNDTTGLQALGDAPAGWGSTPDYRLLSGDTATNFFRAKTLAVAKIGSQNTECTVSFDSNGGTAVASQTGSLGDSLAYTTPTKDGYTFGGWYTDNTTFLNRVTTIPGDCTLYASWVVMPNILDYAVSGENITFTFHPDWYYLGGYAPGEITAMHVRGGFNSWAVSADWSLAKQPDGTWTLTKPASQCQSEATFKFYISFNGQDSDTFSWFGGDRRLSAYELPASYLEGEYLNLVLRY